MTGIGATIVAGKAAFVVRASVVTDVGVAIVECDQKLHVATEKQFRKLKNSTARNPTQPVSRRWYEVSAERIS